MSNITKFKNINKFTYFLIIFSIICINLKEIKSENELAESLQKEINKAKEDFPPNWKNYFQMINSRGILKIDKCEKSIADHRFRKVHQFTDEVINFFNDIMFAESTYFRTFSFGLKRDNSYYNEFICAARTVGSKIEFAYMEVETTSKTIQKYHTRDYKEFVWYFPPVWVKHHQVIFDPFTTDDIIIIYQTLVAHSYVHISRMTDKILTALQTKQFVLSFNSVYYSNNDQFYLKIQEDGNMVLYKRIGEKVEGNDEKNDEAIWASQTFEKGNPPNLLAIEENGDLALYDSDWSTIWKADFVKNNNLPYSLEITDNGEMHLNDSKGNLMWKNGDKAKYKVQRLRNLNFLE